MLGIIAIVLLVLLLVGGIPAIGWHNASWYPYGSGVGLLIVLVLVILLVRGA